MLGRYRSSEGLDPSPVSSSSRVAHTHRKYEEPLTPAGNTYAAYDTGNGLCKTQTTASPSCPSDSDSSTTGRNYGGVYKYDASGNQTQNPTAAALTYNGADMTIGSGNPAGTAYDYTYASNNQVDRDSTTTTPYSGSPSTITYRNGIEGIQSTSTTLYGAAPGYIRDPQGALIGTYSDSGTGTASTTDYYAFDGHGSVIAIISPSGTVDAQYRYDPYGKPLTGSGLSTPPANSYAYKGEYLDASGLYKMGLRYYDPMQGRWTQQDSINTIGDPTNGNRYAAFGDDPAANSDPTGASFFDDVGDFFTQDIPNAASDAGDFLSDQGGRIVSDLGNAFGLGSNFLPPGANFIAGGIGAVLNGAGTYLQTGSSSAAMDRLEYNAASNTFSNLLGPAGLTFTVWSDLSEPAY